MKTLPDTHVREVSCCPSPVTIWQTLLTRLLDQHYGLTLNDTPFADERVIEQHIYRVRASVQGRFFFCCNVHIPSSFRAFVTS